MPGREREIWMDRIGMGGIRRDVLGEKSDETILFDCLNLDVTQESGAIRKTPGAGSGVLSAQGTLSSGFYPPILTFNLWKYEDTRYAVGVGFFSADELYYYRESLGGSTNYIDDPQGFFTCGEPGLLGTPAYYMNRTFTPRGEAYPGVITEGVNITVPGDSDLDNDGPVEREAKTGFPFIGFITDNGVSKFYHPPFSSSTSNISGHTTATNGRVTGWGGVGSAYNATEHEDAGVDGGLLEFSLFTSVGQKEWQYGYANYGDDYAVGWGVKYAGNNTSRLYLRQAAVGYVYVYADGTTSEMMVLKWDNDLDSSNPHTGGAGKTKVPVNICGDSSSANTDLSHNTNFCVIAWKFRVRLPKFLLQEHSVVGVRVFYSHRSTLEGDTFPYNWANGYKGWETDQDIFGNMREVMYLDEQDAEAGYCRVEESANQSVVEEDTLDTTYFNYVLCPCELSVAATDEVLGGQRDIVIKDRMTLGRKWKEIRGEDHRETGVLVTVGAFAGTTSGQRILVQGFDNGRQKRNYSTYLISTDEIDENAHQVSEYRPNTTPLSYGCVGHVGRLWHWGVKLPTRSDVDWTMLYPTSIDQDSISWPTVLRLDLGVPIRMGLIRQVVANGRDLLVGTTAGIAKMSFGGGSYSEWSRQVLDPDVSIETPHAMRTVNDSTYIVGSNGHVYHYRTGMSGLEDVTRQLFTQDPDDQILPTYANSDESYPTDFVYNKVAIAYIMRERRIQVCYSYNWTQVQTLIINIDTGEVVRGNRFFVSGANPAGSEAMVSTGMSVRPLVDYSANYRQPQNPPNSADYLALDGLITDGTSETIAEFDVEDEDLYNLNGGSVAWAGKSKIMVYWTLERIREAVAGMPPGGVLGYKSYGWQLVDTYDADVGSSGTHGNMDSGTDALYEAGGKFSVDPDGWRVYKIGTVEGVTSSYLWKLVFDKFVSSPSRRTLITLFRMKGEVSDSFTVKFFPDGASTAHTTLTITGGFDEYMQRRVRVPVKHRVRVEIEATANDYDEPFEIRRIGMDVREGGRLGQGT